MMLRRTVIAGLFTLATIGAATAAEQVPGGVSVDHPWARASAGKMMKAGAAYFELKSAGAADSLIAASTPVANKAELHVHRMNKGVMEMRPVAKIDVPAGGSVTLKPGGYHVMLIGLHAPLKQGSHFPMTLTFAKAGTVKIDVTVEAIGAMGPGGKAEGAMQHGDMNHGDMNHNGAQNGAMPGMDKK